MAKKEHLARRSTTEEILRRARLDYESRDPQKGTSDYGVLARLSEVLGDPITSGNAPMLSRDKVREIMDAYGPLRGDKADRETDNPYKFLDALGEAIHDASQHISYKGVGVEAQASHLRSESSQDVFEFTAAFYELIGRDVHETRLKYTYSQEHDDPEKQAPREYLEETLERAFADNLRRRFPRSHIDIRILSQDHKQAKGLLLIV